jgi:hypothetical protein
MKKKISKKSKISKKVSKRSKIMTKCGKMGNIEGKKRCKVKGCGSNSTKLITAPDVIKALKDLIPIKRFSACWYEHNRCWNINIFTD